MPIVIRDIPASDPAAPYEVGAVDIEFPFLVNLDPVAFILTRTYKQTIAGYMADKLAARYMPGVTLDPVYPSAVLISESKTSITASAQYAFTRRYSRIPGTQTVPGSVMLNRPDIPSSFDYAATRVDGVLRTVSRAYRYAEAYNVDQYAGASADVYSIKTCTTAQVIATSGTFTLTYKTSTTAGIAFGASNATVAAAFNGLVDVITDGLTVGAGSNLTSTGALSLAASVGAFLASPVLNAAGLGPTEAQAGNATLVSSTAWQFNLPSKLTSATHGLTHSGPLAVRATSSSGSPAPLNTLYLITEPYWSVFDANSILTTNGPVIGAPPSSSGFGTLIRTYSPGAAPVPVNRVTRFSLSPLTPDTYQGDGAVFFDALFSGVTPINLQVGDSSRWPDENSIIYALTTTQVSADDI